MEAAQTSAPPGNTTGRAGRTARRSTFEHELVMAAIALVADGRYPEVDVVNIDTADPIERDLDARATAASVAIQPLEPVEECVHGLAVRRR